jgi:hypothetical protein
MATHLAVIVDDVDAEHVGSNGKKLSRDRRDFKHEGKTLARLLRRRSRWLQDRSDPVADTSANRNQNNVQWRTPMREVDRQGKYNRRVFLQGAATTVPAVAIASAGLASATPGRGCDRADADDAEDAGEGRARYHPHDFCETATTSPRSNAWDGKAADPP